MAGKVASIIYPVTVWLVGQIYGKAIARIYAPIGYLCQHPEGTQVMDRWKSYFEPKLPALDSPSWRRRWRKGIIKELKRDEEIRIRKEALKPDIVYFEDHYQILKVDPSLLKDVRQVEWRAREKLETLAREPEMVDMAFPIEKTVPPQYIRPVLDELGKDGYRTEVVAILHELVMNPYIEEDEIRVTSRSPLFKLFSIDPKSPSLKQAVREKPRQVAELFFLRMVELANDPDSSLVLLRFLLGRLLLKRLSIRTPEARIPDDMADKRAAGTFETIEKWVDFEIWHDDLPAAQRRAIDVCREVEAGTGSETLKGQCEAQRESYAAVRKNLERARKNRPP